MVLGRQAIGFSPTQAVHGRRIKLPKRVECPICGEICSDRNALSRHLDAAHEGSDSEGDTAHRC